MAPVQVDVDYYAVLEISNTAPLSDVTKSYRRLAKACHPDKNLNKDTKASFQLVGSSIFQTTRQKQRQRLTLR